MHHSLPKALVASVTLVTVLKTSLVAKLPLWHCGTHSRRKASYRASLRAFEGALGRPAHGPMVSSESPVSEWPAAPPARGSDGLGVGAESSGIDVVAGCRLVGRVRH